MKSCIYAIAGNNGKILTDDSSSNCFVPIHSCAKPFQALPVFMLGLDVKYHLTLPEITILSSSSLGQTDQVAVIRNLLKKTGLQLEELILPSTSPTGIIALREWKASNCERSPVYHPCIGNHIAMYLAQKHLTGDGSDYLSPKSVVQQMILNIVCDLFRCTQSEIIMTTDNCGAPCYSVPLRFLALGYYSFCNNSKTKYSTAIQKHRYAAGSCPTYLEGDGCLSTILTSKPGIFAKTGINSTIGICIDDLNYGIAIHSPSSNWMEISYTIIQLFSQLGIKDIVLFQDLLSI